MFYARFEHKKGCIESFHNLVGASGGMGGGERQLMQFAGLLSACAQKNGAAFGGGGIADRNHDIKRLMRENIP